MEDRTRPRDMSAADHAADPLDALGALTDAIVATDRTIAQMQASREVLLALAAELAPMLMDDDGAPAGFDAVQWDSRAAELAQRSVAAEIGAATRTSDRSVQRQMGQAWDLVTRFPSTMKALGDGRIGLAHARVIREAGIDLDESAARDAYEAVVVARAEYETPNRLRRFAEREAEKSRPEPLEGRFDKARCERRVWVTPLLDGMAELTALLPIAVAYGVHRRLSDMAEAHAENRPRGGDKSPAKLNALGKPGVAAQPRMPAQPRTLAPPRTPAQNTSPAPRRSSGGALAAGDASRPG
ncbi:DUF222 domain-containing protein [Arthrobacter sp. NPDC090010]|uniref:DUF222 domain-containing protein n=1 Tax=Arthrobacter sp. NPDC090010 TaxID=3363942 RepID=UPI00381B7C20